MLEYGCVIQFVLLIEEQQEVIPSSSSNERQCSRSRYVAFPILTIIEPALVQKRASLLIHNKK